MPYFVFHPTFRLPTAERDYGPCPEIYEDLRTSHMDDDTTRDRARRMHYAAYRMEQAAEPVERGRWERHYLACRNQIVVGNRKLTYRAVRRWSPPATLADDLTGDCQIVLIQAVAAYNPWLGIRFSTYAFTCLMRGLSRKSQKYSSAGETHAIPWESIPDDDPPSDRQAEQGHAEAIVDSILQMDDLLTPREKAVLRGRYQLGNSTIGTTLKEVGISLGLSKERIRQVQASALSKLRDAMLTSAERG